MAQILIDIPDELAQQLAPFQGQFSEFFTRLIAAPFMRGTLAEDLGNILARWFQQKS
jgi:hypothetical protein